MSAGFSRRRRVPVLLSLFAALGLAGCENEYSAAIRYALRTDPIVTTEKLGPERDKPDRPGQLPIMSIADLREIPNALFATREELESTLSNKILDPSKLDDDKRRKLQEKLDELFGTPREPRVRGIEDAERDKLKLDDDTLKHGSHYYRIHCLHCHGVTGNGRGPTAHWVNPHPRDYRQGWFKFQSVDQASDGISRKPRREDLFHTLEEGIEGTAMPSFRLLGQKDLNYLVSYVIHLSIRGEAEYAAMKAAISEGEDPVEYAVLMTKKLGQDWSSAQDKPIKIEPYKGNPDDKAAQKESVQRGRALFLADEPKLKSLFNISDPEKLNKLKGASCVSCHKDFGRQASYKFDIWGTFVKPADLTRGVYRGGRTPRDLYYRIHSGINGSGMANFGGVLSSDQIWDLVNFIRVLPYPGMRKEYNVQID